VSDGCGTYAHWTLHVWAPHETLVRALNELTDVEASLLTPDGDLPDDAGQVEFVVPGWGIGRERLAEVIAANPKLRVIQTPSAGVDHLVDLVPDTVRICDARGVFDVPTAEWVLAGVLGHRRDLPRYARQQAGREWLPAEAARELAGSRVLIVGHGSIGAAVEARLAPFGVSVTRVARTARDGVAAMAELPRLLPEADIVVLLVPLTDLTRGLVDKEFLAALPDGALLVNAARGAVVDTDALLAELSTGRLGAVLDVTDPEPLPADDPLWSAPGLLLTPHVAGPTTQLRERVLELVLAQVVRYRDGNPLENVVTDGY
jgi:phosphoglycerate dehydrogenase-like enzyme